MNLNQYIGRIVRLTQRAFQEIVRQAKYQGAAVENYFLVASVSRKMGKLICYGANVRIAVRSAEVILV